MMPTYLVLPPDVAVLGGAEKRLIGMWLHVMRRSLADVRLVISEPMLGTALEVDEFDDLERFRDRIVVLPRGRFSAARLRWRLHRLRAADPRAVFHYAMLTPGLLGPLSQARTLYTLPAASLTNFNTRGLLYVFTGCLRARRIDVLDEDVGKTLARIFPMRKRAITVTPGSFVELDRFAPLPFAQKKNRLVFLGAFIRNKQVFRLLERLPAIDAQLRARGLRDLEYVFLGRDSGGDEPSATPIVTKLAATLPIRAFYATRPHEVLREAKVYFALQRLENYPSKALLEAMASGCIPIVTDVGKSRQIAREEFAHFVPGPFEAEHVADAAARILELDGPAFEAKVAAARAFIRQRFSADAMTEYYLELYSRLGAESA